MDDLLKLKVILKNSFAGIKTDMAELKQVQEQGLANSYKTAQDVEGIKNDYTPKDKFNLLKIQVGDVNEQLKKIWDLEKEIKKLGEKKTDRADFEKDIEKFRNDVSKRFSEQNSNFSRKIVQLNDRTATAFDRINEGMKVLVTKNQVTALISDINSEFTSLKNEVVELRKIKDTITARELDRRTGLINARMDLLAKEVVKANHNISQCVTEEQVKKLVEEVNAEFNDIKHAVSELSKMRNLIRVIDSESVKDKEFGRKMADLHSDFGNSKKEFHELRDFLLKNYSKNDETKRMITSVELNLVKKISELEDRIIDFKKSETHDIRKLKDKIREEKPKIIEIKERTEKAEKVRKPRSWKWMSAVSIILIILAFASLAGAVIEYFALEPGLTNYLTIGAVVMFVVGIILRVVAVRSRK